MAKRKVIVVQEELPIKVEPSQKVKPVMHGSYCLITPKGYIIKGYVHLDYYTAKEAAKQLAITSQKFVTIKREPA